MSRISVTTAILAAALWLPLEATAQDREWNWSVTPYAWLAGIKGTTGVEPLVAEVDQSLSDILSDLELGGMLSLDGNNGTWGALLDVFYVKLEDSTQTQVGRVRGELEQWIVTFAPYYRVVANERGVLDVGVGGRYIDIDVDVSTPIGSDSGSRNWTDPLLLGSVSVPVSEKAYLNLTGDIGGFGVESDLTWQIFATAGYAVTDSLDLLVGYQHLDVDYSKDGFVFDVATRGFVLGARFKL